MKLTGLLRNVICEQVGMDHLKLSGNVPKFVQPLIYDFVNFVRQSIGISNGIQLEINFKKINKNEIGFVNFQKIVSGKNKIVIADNSGYKIMLQYISHELTHIKQIKNKELDVKNGHFIWHDEVDISIEDYNVIVKQYNFDAYINLNWEKEAYSNQSNIVDKYKNSSQLKLLIDQTTEPNLKLILMHAL